VAALVDHGQRFMAHLSAVRMMQARRTVPGAAASVAPLLAQSRAELAALLVPGVRQILAPTALRPSPLAEVRGTDSLPTVAPEADVLPWLQRRLQLLLRDALAIQRAAGTLLPATPATPAAPAKPGI
jgi:hypothetical protein